MHINETEKGGDSRDFDHLLLYSLQRIESDNSYTNLVQNRIFAIGYGKKVHSNPLSRLEVLESGTG